LGSTFTVDDVELSGVLPTSILAAAAPSVQILAYPNPTYGRVIFNFGLPTSGFYRLYSPQGSLLGTTSFSGNKEIFHNLWGMPAGQYIFRFYISGQVITKFVVKL
jgi:hypothetical protein